MTKTIYREEYRQVVSRLREAREAIGLSQASLALHLGRNQQWVSLMESGSRRLDIIEFAEVCLALGTDPTAILASAMETLGKRRSGRPRT
ncbi:MAG: helix-turn-helix transcriptional regulator [Pseudoxanthomonas sp.]